MHNLSAKHGPHFGTLVVITKPLAAAVWFANFNGLLDGRIPLLAIIRATLAFFDICIHGRIDRIVRGASSGKIVTVEGHLHGVAFFLISACGLRLSDILAALLE